MEIIEKIKNSSQFKHFQTVFNNGKMSHAYLILGENANTNNLFCLEMAKLLVCEKHLPCGSCTGCKKIDAGFHPDVFFYPLGKTFLVGDSEDILANVAIKPMESSYKIFLINNFDSATVQAQNKLLKTVEEAPNNVVFIFNAVKPEKVLQTIKSRTQEIEIPSFCEISLNQMPDYDFLANMLENLSSSKNVINYISKFAEKNGFMERLRTLGAIFEQLLYQNIGSKQFLGGQASSYTVGAIAEILQEITLAKRQFESNVSTNLIADHLLIKILEVRYKWNKIA